MNETEQICAALSVLINALKTLNVIHNATKKFIDENDSLVKQIENSLKDENGR